MKPCFSFGTAVILTLVAACGSDTSPSEAAAASSGTGGGSGTGQGGGAGQGGAGQGGAGSMSIAAICDDYCACVGCSQIEQEGCIGTWDMVKSGAEAKGCLQAYDALVDCLTTTTTCSAGMPSDRCDDERSALDMCMT